jgi:hypothetical protein
MSSCLSFIEQPGAPHWYPSVLNSPNVQTFLSAALEDVSRPPAWASQITLTVAIPSESGSFHGFTIRELEVPGRFVTYMLFCTHIDLYQTSKAACVS